MVKMSVDGQRGVERSHLLLNGDRKRERISGGAHDDGRRAGLVRDAGQNRKVHRGLDRLSDVIDGIADNAHDLIRSVEQRDRHMPADWIFPGEKLIRELLADDQI